MRRLTDEGDPVGGEPAGGLDRQGEGAVARLGFRPAENRMRPPLDLSTSRNGIEREQPCGFGRRHDADET